MDIANNDYTRLFAHYTEKIINLRQAKIQGEVIVAKPVLLLALIDGSSQVCSPITALC